jgi:hypothetical protein
MTRQIKGLSWAWALPEKPSFIKNSSPRGTKAKGLAYERLVAKALPQAQHGTWFSYRDKNGPGWCQTDLLLALAGRIFVIEVKLTDTAEAYTQLQQLYLPVVALALQRPTFGLVVAKNLTPGGTRHAARSPGICEDLASALTLAAAGALPLLHWLGRSPLITPNDSAAAQLKSDLAMVPALA